MVESPHIEHIDDFIQFLRDPVRVRQQIGIYTRFEKTVQEFLEFHAIQGARITPVSKLGLESTIIHNDSRDGFLHAQE